MSTVGIATAHRKRRELALLTAEMSLAQQIGDVRLADLEHETMHEHGVPGPEVEIVGAERLPVLGVEDRLQMHRRRELEHRVAVVVRLAGA